MTYSTASELLGLTTPKSLRAQADLARSIRASYSAKTPLRFKVACDVLIREWEKVSKRAKGAQRRKGVEDEKESRPATHQLQNAGLAR